MHLTSSGHRLRRRWQRPSLALSCLDMGLQGTQHNAQLQCLMDLTAPCLHQRGVAALLLCCNAEPDVMHSTASITQMTASVLFSHTGVRAWVR